LYPSGYVESISIGAIGYKTNNITLFSSRGPVGNLTKPDLVAPGYNITSIFYKGGGFTQESGTSFSAPNAAGAFSLLYSSNPFLIRRIYLSRMIMFYSATHKHSNDCNSNFTSPYKKNNVYGFGTINILKAVKVAQEIWDNICDNF